MLESASAASSPRDALPTDPVKTVMVVDDDVLIRTAIAAYLRECGFRALEAAGADEALLILRDPEQVIDVVLTDIEMRGSLDGFGLAKWIRENRDGLQVILAGTPKRAAAAAGDLCEHGPMLRKPYEPQLVIAHIRRLLGSRDAQPRQT